MYIYCELLNAYLSCKEKLWNGGKINEFMEMWLKKQMCMICGTCRFIGRWRFRPGYGMRCGLLGDADSALIVISRGLWLIHLCYAWDAKVVWRVPPPRSISAMLWDAKDSMTWPPSPPWCLWVILWTREIPSWCIDLWTREIPSWYIDLRARFIPSWICDMWTRYISLS